MLTGTYRLRGKPDHVPPKEYICEHCGKKYAQIRSKSRFCSDRCMGAAIHAQKRISRKRWAVDYLGGKCSLCGYFKTIRALDFHHNDPAHKTANMSQLLVDGSIESVKVELDKCSLVCANCHREMEEHEVERAKVDRRNGTENPPIQRRRVFRNLHSRYNKTRGNSTASAEV